MLKFSFPVRIAAVIVVVRMDGQPYLCKTDEVGEICVHSTSTGAQYWGLQGLTNQTFKVQPLQADGTTVSDSEYVRSGLLGFLGPVCCRNHNFATKLLIFVVYKMDKPKEIFSLKFIDFFHFREAWFSCVALEMV